MEKKLEETKRGKLVEFNPLVDLRNWDLEFKQNFSVLIKGEERPVQWMLDVVCASPN